MTSDKTLICDKCNSTIFLTLVQHQSYFLKCSVCKTQGPATTFSAISKTLSGQYEIIEVDNDTKPIRLIASGQISNLLDLIKTELSSEKLIWLKRLDNQLLFAGT